MKRTSLGAGTLMRNFLISVSGMITLASCDARPPEFAVSPVDASVLFSAGAGPNEPTGYVRFAEHSFEALPESGPPGTCSGVGVLDGCWFIYDPEGNVSLVSVADAPASPTGVFQFRFPTGLPPGAEPALLEAWDGPGEVSNTEFREIYESSWVRVPTPDFEMQAVGVKLLGFVGVAREGGSSVPNQVYFISWNPTGVAGPLTSVRVTVCQQVVADRCMEQNVLTDPVFSFGVWHHLEYVMILNEMALANGKIRVWWDGTLIMAYDDVMWRDAANPSGFYGRRWHPTWGGGGGSSKTRDDFLQIDHIYLSGIECDPTLGCL